MTSDEFFAEHDLRELLGGPVELAFIDGLHLFEQVLRDFVNLERCSTAHTVIILHDCLPARRGDGERASGPRTSTPATSGRPRSRSGGGAPIWRW